MTKRKPRSRSGPNLPDGARGTVQLNTRLPRAVREAYEREAERRGVTLGALVRARLEGDSWYPLPPATMALLDKHGDLLRAGVPESDPERVEVERQIRVLVRGHDGDPPKMTAEGNAFARSLLGEEMD